MLDNSKTERKMYTMQDLLQDDKVVMSRNMHGTILKMQKIC